MPNLGSRSWRLPLAAGGIALSACAPALGDPLGETPPRCARTIAHRGFPGYAPRPHLKQDFGPGEIQENTLDAMERAHALGFSTLEMDVTPTADDHLVLSHDPNLRRLSGQRLDISRATLAQVQAVTLADGQHPVTVEEVFARFGRTTRYDIEVKAGPFDLDAADLLVQTAWQVGVSDLLTLCSFSPAVLAHVEQIAPEVETALAVTDQLLLPRLGLTLRGAAHTDRLALHHTMLSAGLIERLGEQGYPVTAWTVDDAQRIATLQRWGVDAVMTNMVTPSQWPECLDAAERGGPVGEP